MVIQRRLGWTAKFAPRPLAAVLLAVALCASGCTSDDELSAGDAATVADGSSGEYAVDGGEWTPVEAGDVVPEGAAVRPAGDELRLEFRDGTARLSAEAEAVVAADRITVDRGEALVFTQGGLGGAVADATVEGAGRYRITSGLSSRVGVYEGSVTVRRPAQESTVAQLRELDLSAFRLGDAEPLHYSDTDAWDRELLAAAIAFDGEAERLRRGMEVDLGSRPLPGRFYRKFTVAGAVELLAAQAPVVRGSAFGPPSDVMLTMFVAEAAAGDAVVPAVRRVTGLRDEGARWGLIAVELDVASQEVVAAIDDIDGERIVAAERLATRRRDNRADDDDDADGDAAGAEVAAAADTGAGAPVPSSTGADGTDASFSGNDGGGDSDPVPPPDGPGDDDPGDKDPRNKPGDDPPDDPEPEEPTLQEQVTKVVNDVVTNVPDLPEDDDLPLP